jgi:hypothetical protein
LATEEPQQNVPDRKPCVFVKIIQNDVNHSELAIIVKLQVLDGKQDIGLAGNGNFVF